MIDTLCMIALMLGLSVRSPNEQPNKFDYEISSGFEYSLGSKNILTSGTFWGWRERENGEEYYGVDLNEKVALWKRIEFSGTYQDRNAQDITRGDATVNAILSPYVKIGVSNVWDKGEHAVCGNIEFGDKYLTAIMKVYEKGLESLQANLKYPLQINKWFLIEPMFKYLRDRSGNEHYQGKLNFTFKVRGGNGR